MPITRADLLAPTGPVETAFFPRENKVVAGDPDGRTALEIRLDTYISQAYAKVNTMSVPSDGVDEAARAWALHLTFDAAYMLKANDPGSENSEIPGIGSQAFAKDQRDAFQRKADYWLSRFDEFARAANTGTLRFKPSRFVRYYTAPSKTRELNTVETAYLGT